MNSTQSNMTATACFTKHKNGNNKVSFTDVNIWWVVDYSHLQYSECYKSYIHSFFSFKTLVWNEMGAMHPSSELLHFYSLDTFVCFCCFLSRLSWKGDDSIFPLTSGTNMSNWLNYLSWHLCIAMLLPFSSQTLQLNPSI